MKVRFLGAQKFETGSKVYCKVLYSADNTQNSTSMDLDDGKAFLSFTGEKNYEIKCDVDTYEASKKCVAGDFCTLTLSALPNNPSKNICSGITISSKKDF